MYKRQDDKWLIPHFEKMLYDNALLLIAYLSAYQFTGDAFYAEAVSYTHLDVYKRQTRVPGGHGGLPNL